MSIRVFIVCLIIAAFSTVIIADDPNELDYKPGELIVRFAPKANGIQRTKAERRGLLDSIGGGDIRHSFKRVPGLTVVKFPAGYTVKDMLSVFKTTDGILYAEPNYKGMIISTIPDDTYFNNLWGMHNTGQTSGTADADIDAPQAWDIATDAEDIIVAVIDSGVDYNHEDLAANMWTNQAELNGTTGVDDDENGYMDDIYGWDFADKNNNPDDCEGHGTHVAGTIGGIGNNGTGVTGVCWKVKMMPLKITAACQRGILTSDAIDAIEYAVEMGANILNNSWGGGSFSQAEKDVIENARDAGVLFIAAAGNYGNNNDSNPFYPASYVPDNIISVMATDHDDERGYRAPGGWASNYGVTKVDLAAPGKDIYSCIPGDRYNDKSGTSMATPHVAGACALIWSINPKLHYSEVKDIILNSVDKLDSMKDFCVTGGRLNLHKALVETFSLTLNTDDGIMEGNCAEPNGYITYNVSYSNPDTDPCNPLHIGTVNDVNIIDVLPDEVDFDSASGSYTLDANTIIWNIGTLSPGQTGSVTLTVKVKPSVETDSVITNCSSMTGDGIDDVNDCESTPVCCDVMPDVDPASNLLLNPGFEDVNPCNSSEPEYWDFSGGLNGPDPIYEITYIENDSTYSHSGDDYVMLDATSFSWTAVSQSIPAAEDIRYTLTAYSKVTPAYTPIGVELEFKNLTGGVLREDVLAPEATTSWALYTVYSNPAPIGTRSITCTVSVENAASYTYGKIAYFDDLNLVVNEEFPLGGCQQAQFDWDFYFLIGDLNRDCNVGMYDFSMMAAQWLESPTTTPNADIAPPGGDGIVDFYDIALLAENWLLPAGESSTGTTSSASGGGSGPPEDPNSRTYAYIITVGQTPVRGIEYDYNTINDAIAAMVQNEPDESHYGCIEVYPGTYAEQLNDFYPGGHNLPAYCDLIGKGSLPEDVVIQHQRRNARDPNFTDIASEIYADGLRCEGDNIVENIKIHNVGNNQNSVRFWGEGTLRNCIVKSVHDAVTSYGHLVISDCVIEGWYRPCVHAYSTFEISDSTFYPKTRSWGGQHPAGIKALRSGTIDNVTISANIATSDYEPHYDTPWLAGVITQLRNPNDTVTITNTTMNLTLTTLYHDNRQNETAEWQLFGVVNGGRNPSPTTTYPGKVVVDNCRINLTGIEDSSDPNGDGRGIMVSGISVRGSGTAEVLGNTQITTSRTTANHSGEGCEYSLNNQNGTLKVDTVTADYDSSLTNGTIDELE
ncbi:MAG: S8 family serine peptidase [Planctomycetes bacterium]|nr:S8 family serine peptidase [Planctomycetota bacterium]